MCAILKQWKLIDWKMKRFSVGEQMQLYYSHCIAFRAVHPFIPSPNHPLQLPGQGSIFYSVHFALCPNEKRERIAVVAESWQHTMIVVNRCNAPETDVMNVRGLCKNSQLTQFSPGQQLCICEHTCTSINSTSPCIVIWHKLQLQRPLKRH